MKIDISMRAHRCANRCAARSLGPPLIGSATMRAWIDATSVSQSGLTHAENASRVFSAKGVQGDPAAGCRLERTLM
jgi:hypothetical protein